MPYASWVCCFGALFGIGAIGCSRPTPPTDFENSPVAVHEVDVDRIQLQSWPRTVRVQGSMLAYEDAVIGSKLPGRVAAVNVDLGSIVRQGDVMVELVRHELELRVGLAEAQLRQACAVIGIKPEEDETLFNASQAPGVTLEQALVAEAQSIVNRAEQLLSSRAVSKQEFDTMVAQLKAAQARYSSALNLVNEQISMIGVRRKELALAKQLVVDSQITAPFDGVVGERHISPGEFVSVGQTLVSLVRADLLRFTAGVPESHAAKIKEGQTVNIVDGLNITSPISTKITRISPTVMQASRSVLIEADVPNPLLDLQAGIFAEAEVVIDAHNESLVLPLSAVSRFAGVQKVWVVSDGIAEQKTIRTGREDGHRIEILQGIDRDDLIIVDEKQGHGGPVVARERAAESQPQANVPSTSSVANCDSLNNTN
ncbi:Toluene efflux pump periplasmic linker protein TtgG precursor [Adhaeretor mobilis]|uniref:Toluene efflux pump periplasmic linker protein TtgG n=2 Tax=Adhaeretor mobilis TaxID=1930276 RepID=A0A517N2X0_9BACT|nr:Toluene efflux pump periplasmic linker protein TtgG precursor [Adhaeretor mobilis]